MGFTMEYLAWFVMILLIMVVIVSDDRTGDKY